MTYILYLSAIIAGLICKKSKWITGYILGVMFILSVYKYNCADLSSYQTGYVQIANGSLTGLKYIGQYLITKFCTSMGMTFIQYLILYYTLALGCLYMAIHRATKKVNFVLSCYMIYSFGIDVIQMKTMLADAVILLALTFLFEAKVKRKLGKPFFIGFCVLAVVASTIHFMSSYFLVIGIIYYISDSEKFYKYMMQFTIIAFVLSYFDILPKIFELTAQYIPIFSAQYISVWLQHKTKWGWIFPAFGLLLLLLHNRISIQNEWLEESGKANLLIKEMKDFSYSIVCILPFLLYNTTYMRYFRVYVEMIIMISSYFSRNGWKISKKVLVQKVIFVIIMVYLYYCEIYPVFDSTLGAMLKYNSLFN